VGDKIVFARVDNRLIHGQVMTQWVKGIPSCEAIIIVDNILASDEYMKNLYKMSAPSETSVEIVSVDEEIKGFANGDARERGVFLLFRDIDTVKEVVMKGLPIKSLNIGGIPKTGEKKNVIASVSLTKAEMQVLWRLDQEFGVEIYFQMVPGTARLPLSRALRLFGLEGSEQAT